MPLELPSHNFWTGLREEVTTLLDRLDAYEESVGADGYEAERVSDVRSSIAVTMALIDSQEATALFSDFFHHAPR